MYIGIDLGTTGCKVVLFDAKGGEIKQFNKEYPLICRDNFVEQDALLWWQLVTEGMAYVAEGCGEQVKGISVSTQGISFVPVDAEGQPLSNAITWLDTRAEAETAQLTEALGADRIYRITGKFANPCYTLPKLMWLKAHRPELYEKAQAFMLPLDFLNFRLTGIALCDYSIAGGIMAYDLENKCYSQEILEAAGIPEVMLPKVGCMGQLVGGLLPEAAALTGLTPGCPVFLGGQDQKLAALGAGIREQAITVSFGTASAVTRLTKFLPEQQDFSRFRFNEDYYSYEGVVDTSGAALKWLTSILNAEGYEAMNALAVEAGGSGGVTFCTDLTTGGSITGLTLATTRGNLVYALFEGVSRKIGEFADAMGGCEELYLFGGGSKSPIWCQVLANVTGKKVVALSTPETASLGAAILASQGTVPPATPAKIYEKEAV